MRCIANDPRLVETFVDRALDCAGLGYVPGLCRVVDRHRGKYGMVSYWLDGHPLFAGSYHGNLDSQLRQMAETRADARGMC